MDEYISREAFKARIREHQKKCASPDEIAAFTVFSFLLQAVDEEPAADVQPIRHGRWIIADDVEHFIAVCSECGRTEDSRDIKDMQYCHCGARMDGEQNENN